MEKQEKHSVSSIGMFDLLRGMGMIMILFGHTVNNYSLSSVMKGNNIILMVFGIPYILLGAGLMQAFFLTSGYGFRKTSIVKCIKRQGKLLLLPYLYGTIATAVLHFCTRYVISRSVKLALWQTWQVVGGFLLGLPTNLKIFGVQYYSCGAMWYIVALLIGWMILNILMNVTSGRYLTIAVWGVACIGWLIGIGRVIPFSISQGMIAVLYLHYGYRIKKQGLLAKNITKGQICIAILVCAMSVGITAAAGVLDNMAEGIWSAGIISILIDGCIGFFIIYVVIKLNSCKNRFLDGVKKIGCNSLYIFIIHTVEMHGIPWWMFAEYMKGYPVAGCILQFLLRSLLIVVGVIVIKRALQWKRVK